MDLLALADFNLVARHGGVGRAARATARPKATLSRRVAELEESLGCRLFERGARTLKLTEEGRALHERTAILLGEIDDVAAAIGAGAARPRGRLRISAPQVFAHVAMGRLSAHFALRHPDVQLEVTAEDRTVDLVEDAYDLVIRVNPRPDDDLTGRCFLHDRLVLVAVPTRPRPAAGEPVPAILRAGAAPTRPWRIQGAEGLAEITPKPILKLSSLIMVRDAVHTGIGAAVLPLSMVAHDIASGRLARWGDLAGGEVEIWALYTARRLLNARVAAFLDCLRDAFPTGTSDELSRFLA
ncbi:LysR family transcriptional regulator [Gluconacetobacter takamatsuzukensis]|uniref:LysR family transcriptional regulator n=1 Tax=Gluconacetobacter takamatsuzukensis TaxID=1286190 RepID=A0A7W4KEG5_9PROT|nr:LysR substrate-binding domain-containing protein [Gluconacetobacter takamatsuzukensis]MBB2205474.1 LysR family transcriptional regulator [Gluconacetobacter takamatsuzukensis]